MIDLGKVKFLLYRNIQNAAEIHSKILKGEMQCAIVKPSLVIDLFQLKLAVHTALYNRETKTMKTRSVYLEIIYSLSGNKKITDSLKTFGFGESDTEAFFIILEEENAANVLSLVKGDAQPLDSLRNLTDVSQIKEIYKVKDSELAAGSLLDAVVNRMSTKEYITI